MGKFCITNKLVDKFDTNPNVIFLAIAFDQKDKVENMIAEEDSQGLDTIDQFYSGWYYVKGFSINYNQRD